MENNSKMSRMFIILVVVAVLLAGFLTWNLMKPKQAEQFYEQAFGFKTVQPAQDAIGKGVIHFKKTEE